MSLIEASSIRLPGGIELVCRRCGTARAPKVLLLHGFPQAAFIWDAVMAGLSDRAQCWAPNLRGFWPSSSPPAVQEYRAREVLKDLCGVIDAMGGRVDLLVGHDWGGALAWSLAAARPQCMGQLLIVNAPHPGPFLRDLRQDAMQREASAYMNALCRPEAEQRLAQDDFARLWRFFEGPPAAPGRAPAWLHDAARQRYRAVWRNGLTGALNYNRASPLRPPQSAEDAVMRLVLDDESITVRVPTTVLWGELDRALRPGLLDGLSRWVPDLRIERVPDASHWVIDEQPVRVCHAIETCLGFR